MGVDVDVHCTIWIASYEATIWICSTSKHWTANSVLCLLGYGIKNA